MMMMNDDVHVPIPPAASPQLVDHHTHSKIATLRRAQWLRAAILGANDGLLSITSLMLGAGAANEDARYMVLTGLAGALAGACSMAVGEFVSVSTQRDIENTTTPPPLVNNSPKKVPPHTAEDILVVQETIATSSSEHGHIHDDNTVNYFDGVANPYKAAVASGLAFLLGSSLPLLSCSFGVPQYGPRIAVIVVVTSIALAVSGCVGAYLGGSPIRKSGVRVLLGGWTAMAITYGLLKPFDTDHDP